MLDPNISTTLLGRIGKKKLLSSDDPFEKRMLKIMTQWSFLKVMRLQEQWPSMFWVEELNESDEIARLMASVVAQGAF